MPSPSSPGRGAPTRGWQTPPPIWVARWWSLPLHSPVARWLCFCGTLRLPATQGVAFTVVRSPCPGLHRAPFYIRTLPLGIVGCACLDFPLLRFCETATTRCTLTCLIAAVSCGVIHYTIISQKSKQLMAAKSGYNPQTSIIYFYKTIRWIIWSVLLSCSQ